MIMNERGFFTLIGICFLIVVAVIVRGVQESEGNYYSIAEDFQTAAELQNIADSALIKAMDMIAPKVEEILPKRVMNERRADYQPEILSETIDENTVVRVRAEYAIDQSNNNIGTIKRMERKYKFGGNFEDVETETTPMKGVVLISVASRDTAKGKVYRRALGYFFTDEDEEKPTRIYFMNDLSDD